MPRKPSLFAICLAVALAVGACTATPRGGDGDGGGAGGGGTGGGGKGGSDGGSGGTSGGPTGGRAGSGTADADAGGGGGAGAGGGTGTGGTAGTAGQAGANGTAGKTGAGGTGGAPNCGTTTTLKAAASCRNRLFGAALAATHLGESAYTAAAREHSFVTPENEMKWDQIEPSLGNFNFGPADQIVTFAMQNGMKIKGHTLVWHKQLPAWVTSISTASELRSAMVNHITGVMNHYKGKIHAWDVVNEAWITTGKTGDGSPMLRDTVFLQVLGPTFIDEAFTAARQADPGALLIYNEFANEGLSDKSTAVYNMVKDMKMRGIPIDGVGLQMHIGINTAPTAADFATNMQRLADLGLQVFVSEMDVNGCAGYTLEQEGTQYHDMVAACVAQPACAAFTVWGITDKYSWLTSDITIPQCSAGQLPRPLLWDDNYGKKTAYTGVMDALLGR